MARRWPSFSISRRVRVVSPSLAGNAVRCNVAPGHSLCMPFSSCGVGEGVVAAATAGAAAVSGVAALPPAPVGALHAASNNASAAVGTKRSVDITSSRDQIDSSAMRTSCQHGRWAK
ncbi:hypothetical protein D9M72_594550 [compost metagenome]